MSQRFNTLDSFRGLAALLIAVFHFPPIFWGADFPVLRHAYVVTNFFFALSGFILMAAYARKIQNAANYSRFILKRIARLVPMHLVATLAVLGMPLLTHGTDLVLTYLFTGQYGGDLPEVLTPTKYVWVHALLLQGFGLLPELALNFPAWSLGVIFFCAALLGLLQLTLRRHAGWAFAVMALGSAVLLLTQAPHQFASTYDYGFARGALHFFMGSLSYLLWQKLSLGARMGKWAEPAQASALVLALAFMVAAEPNSSLALLNPLVCALVLLAFSVDKGDFHAFLSHPVFHWLSKRSYSMFMTQALVLFIGHQTLEWTTYFQASTFTGHLFGTLALTVYVAALLALSNMTYRWVEQPAYAWLTRLPRRAVSMSKA